MAPRDIPYSVLKARAMANLAPATGMAPNQFTPPIDFTGTGIRAPGMVDSGNPQIDAALLRRAFKTRSFPDSSRYPVAAKVQPTPEEQALGIETEMSPGSSPYMPHQTQAPSVSWAERTKAMNLSMTPEGMAEHFRQLGFEAQVLPHDTYAERQNPMLAEIESGHGYNIAIKEPTTGDWHVLDPQSFEVSDLTDILSDAAITVGSIAGANIAGAGALAARQGAATTARAAAQTAATRGLVPRGIAQTARKTAEAAVTPSTFLGSSGSGWPL